MTNEKKRRYPWQRKRLRMLLILSLPTVLIAVYFVYRGQLTAQVREQLDALRAASLPTNVEELQAWRPMPPDAENAAFLIVQALQQIQPLSPDEASGLPYYSGVGVSRRRPGPFPPDPAGGPSELSATVYAPVDPYPPEIRARLLAVLKKNLGSLQLLHQAAVLPESKFRLDLSDLFQPSLTQLERWDAGERLLSAQASLTAETGNRAQTSKSLLSLLAYAESLRNEPASFAQVQRLETLNQFCTVLERVLNRTDLRANDLQRLLEAVSKVSLAEGIRLGLAGDRALSLSFQERMGSPFMHITGFLDRMTLGILEGAAIIIEMAEKDPAAAQRQWDDWIDSDWDQFRFLVRQEAFQVFARWPAAAARLAAARAALGVELYRAQHGGALPEYLEMLQPDLFSELPGDPWAAGPLKYRLLNPGYVVYSVGEDGIDQEGAVTAPESSPEPGRRKRRASTPDIGMNILREGLVQEEPGP
ncbi:MAG: hypothetical protein HYV26_19625 [Candidatus Hydrogenedentes bacterium]|nr:hypothetical protein [Candidatus Hydrogenedentota bacterium]